MSSSVSSTRKYGTVREENRMSNNAEVRCINREMLGMESSDNLIRQTIPGIPIINTAMFRAGESRNEFSFGYVPTTVGRLGIFAAGKNNVERAVMMLLPETGRADGVLVCITQGFAQAGAALDALGWAKPLSTEFVKFALLKHVINRWGAQLLASRRNLALVYILRAKGASELGPFANDGAFFVDAMSQISALTNSAFSLNQFEAFTFSSGIYDFNRFIAAVGSQLTVNAVYSIDPASSTVISNPSGGRRKQYASGTAGAIRPGFEPMNLERWRNEGRYDSHQIEGRFQYLHNHCLPMYTLHLALTTP